MVHRVLHVTAICSDHASSIPRWEARAVWFKDGKTHDRVIASGPLAQVGARAEDTLRGLTGEIMNALNESGQSVADAASEIRDTASRILELAKNEPGFTDRVLELLVEREPLATYRAIASAAGLD